MRYVSETSIPAIVELFENGVKIIDKPMRTSEPNDSNKQRPITKKILPSLCQIELDEDMEETNKKTISKQTYTFEELKKIISNIKPSTILDVDVTFETPKFIEAIPSFPKGMLRSLERKIEDRTSRESNIPSKNDAIDPPAHSDLKLQNCTINTCKSADTEKIPDHEPKTTTNAQNNHQKYKESNGSDCLQVDDFEIHGTELEFCKKKDYVQQSFDSR